MVRLQHELRRDHPLKAKFDLKRRFAGREPGAIGDAKDMRIDCHGRFAIGHVEHDIRSLAAGARQLFNLGAGARHLAAKIPHQLL